jgi:hypothetical protein
MGGLQQERTTRLEIRFSLSVRDRTVGKEKEEWRDSTVDEWVGRCFH